MKNNFQIKWTKTSLIALVLWGVCVCVMPFREQIQKKRIEKELQKKRSKAKLHKPDNELKTNKALRVQV